MKRAFTLLELLVVIGLLGALASVLIVNLHIDRKQAIEDSVVVKELADIQAAFQIFAGDVSFNSNKEKNYKLAAKYGLSLLLENDDNFDDWDDDWDNERQIGWRGPYLMPEGKRNNLSVIETPFVVNESDNNYYRVIATDNDGDVVSYKDTDKDIKHLYVAYPFWGGGDFTGNINAVEEKHKKFIRRLL
ncbi:MAG: type II secretion system GspH family protein [Planctomycetaceae bacterium]|jgi:prepilin-type N-terminal cleavage/methylation domain-containing protein|nr:type II secretion system GspH family protein [Planctomycetaceae bacterium]